jgi:CubicO group peptidase (beta-lactamase class C family)
VVTTFARATPSSRGVDASGLLAFVDAAEQRGLGLHSLMIARHGDVIAEGWWAPYTADRVHLAYSLSKTFTATAVGVLASQGAIDIDAPLLSHFPEIDPASVSDRWRAVTIAHCLSMSVGHDTDAGDVIWDAADREPGATPRGQLQRIFATELAADPGALFTYNQVATYLLSLVVGRVAGEPLHAVVRSRFLDRLGARELPWHTEAFGFDLGFSGAHVTTETILGVAQLALERGEWRGERLVADWWYERATVPFAPVPPVDPAGPPDWQHGYGFSYWMQHEGYRGDGAYGQFAITLPARSMVIAITSEAADMQATLDAVWEFVVPAVDRPAPTDGDTDGELAARLVGLRHPPAGSSPGVLGPAARLEFARTGSSNLAAEYTAVAVEPYAGGHAVALRRGDEWIGDIVVGDGEWCESAMVADGWRLPVVASGGWVDPTRFVAELRLIETPHRFTITARVGGEAELAWDLMPLMGPDPMNCSVRRVADRRFVMPAPN